MGLTIEELKEKIFSKYKKENWEIKTLGEISREIISGNEITRDQLDSGDHPAIRAGDINSFFSHKFHECISFVDEKSIRDKKRFSCGDILISNIGSQETVGTSTAYLGKNEGFAGVGVNIIKHEQNPIYLSYVLSSKYIKKQIKELAQKSTVFRLYPSTIKKIKIPLPSLEIQNEIVEFLDKFTELEKELEKRKQQYEYYKNLIFNRGINELNWDIKTLEEIAIEIYSGEEITKVQLNTGNYPAIKYIGKLTPLIITKSDSLVDEKLIKKKKYCESGDILFSKFNKIKEIVGKAALYMNEQKSLVGGAVINLKHKQNSKYLSYFFSTNIYGDQMKSIVRDGVFFQIYTNDIKKIKIPLPSLEEQAKVVEILDKLYSITNDIKEGIPMLIQKNREQYSFYRELLLEK